MFLDVCKHFIVNKEDTEKQIDLRKAYRNWFVETYPATEFKDEELVLYYFLQYVDNFNTVISQTAIDSFCRVELQTLLLKKKIKIASTKGLNFEDLGQIMEAVSLSKDALKLLIEDIQMRESELENFILDVDAFRHDRMQEKLYDMYNNGSAMMETMHAKMAGVEDVFTYTQERLFDLEEIYSRDRLMELLERVENDSGRLFQFVSNFGIKPLDAVTGGMFSTELISIEAAPGIGKSKFVLGAIIWRAAVLFKKNCLMFSLEQTYPELDAILVARHYFYLYGEQMNEANIRIADNYEALPADVKQKIIAARDDLFKSGLYGRIELQCVTIYADTFIKTIKRHNKLKGKFDITIIDYIGLVKPSQHQSRANKKDYEVITDVLTTFKAYLRSSNTLGIAVNQMNDTGIKASQQGQSGGPGSAQGGLTVYRSTDKNIVITATAVQMTQNLRGIELTKARGAANLIAFVCKTLLGMALYYYDMDDVAA